ncbi:MAG TPA: DUF692 family protein [Gemmatimonadaceae bacterium]|jgi:uncharacterized protein (UPF0276 family)
MINELPALGVGLTYCDGLHTFVLEHQDLIDIVEVEPQTLWFADRYADDAYHLDENTASQIDALPMPKLVHGVGFPVGGSRPPRRGQLGPLNCLLSRWHAPWMSEHLSFNRANLSGCEFNTGFLLPPLQTEEGIEAAVRSIRSFASEVGVPLAVETGVSYFAPLPGEMPDGEFVAEVTRRANCGILLDLHNLYANEHNGRQPITSFLDQIPLERVWEVHVAGGQEHRGYWLDAHSGAMSNDLFCLAREIIGSLPNVRAIIFELFSSYVHQVGGGVVLAELERLHEIWEAHGREQPRRLAAAARDPRAALAIGLSPEPREWEDTLGALVAGQDAHGPLADHLQQDPGLAITRELVGDFRASMLASTVKLTIRLLLLTLGETSLSDLLNRFWRLSPPQLFASTEAEVFGQFVRRQQLEIPYLDDVLSFELATVAALIDKKPQIVPFEHDPVVVLRALGEGRLPDSPSEGRFEIELSVGDLPESARIPLSAHPVLH